MEMLARRVRLLHILREVDALVQVERSQPTFFRITVLCCLVCVGTFEGLKVDLGDLPFFSGRRALLD